MRPLMAAGEEGEEAAQEQGEEGERRAEEEEEEARCPVRVPEVPTVTAEERAKHEVTHMPFRAWCQHCVRGRGRNRPHLRKRGDADGEIAIPKVALDYFFLGTEGNKASDNPIVIMVDEATGEKYARMVEQKGVGTEGQMSWLIEDLHRELVAWGHPGGSRGQLIIKSDTEPAIVAVREALARRHGGRVVPEKPAVGEKQSNGTVEEAGKSVRDMALTLKDHIETAANTKIEPGDIIVEWLVRWAAMLSSRYMVGADGRTPYERRRGRPCRTPTACFGETVFYKQLHAEVKQKKFESDWFKGISWGIPGTPMRFWLVRLPA